jgi:hypothetical protein
VSIRSCTAAASSSSSSSAASTSSATTSSNTSFCPPSPSLSPPEEASYNAVTLCGECEGIIVASVPNYQGGRNFWGVPPRPGTTSTSSSTSKISNNNEYKAASVSDGLIEVMSVTGTLHMAAIHTDIYDASRLSQCNHVIISVQSSSVDMQVDGEPWAQHGPCTITIAPWCGAPMLVRGGVVQCGQPPREWSEATETETETDTG